jgi:hypothetical protein
MNQSNGWWKAAPLRKAVGLLYPRFFPPGLPPGRDPVRLAPPGLTLWLGLAELPGLGLERVPDAGLPGPPKLGLGFHPGPAFLSAREAELG